MQNGRKRARRKPRRMLPPVVLRRIFGKKVRTLAVTITSLVPPSPSCQCKPPALCLQCSGDPVSFLLHPDDPSHYTFLLHRCFVVLGQRAPPIGTFRPDNRWSQRQIVARTIEMINRERSGSGNVICCGYNKGNQSSPVIKFLTSSAWNLLLKRVGDDIMLYLLNHASIFSPLPLDRHQQVSGPPISNLAFNFLKQKVEPQNKTSTMNHSAGCRKRGDRIAENENNSVSKRQRLSSTFLPDVISSCNYNCNEDSNIKLSAPHPADRSAHMSLPEEVVPTVVAGTAINEVNKTYEFEVFNDIKLKGRKRSRPFRWQRCRNCRLLGNKESCDNSCYVTGCVDEVSLHGRPQHGLNNSLNSYPGKMAQQCSCCLWLQAPRLITKGMHINRQPIFYSSEHSSSVLPRKHVLYSLRPNFNGSISLFGIIFGTSNSKESTPSMLCSHTNAFCLTGSACLLHSLLELLKVLIHQSRCCKHLRLLDKHCFVSSLDQDSQQDTCSMNKGNDTERRASKNSNSFIAEYSKSTPEAVDPQVEAGESYCTKSQVVSFIWAVCRNLVPSSLLGDSSNQRILRRNISKLIHLRRYEKFSLKQCLHKLKSSGFPLLSKKYSLHYLNTQLLDNAQGQNLEMHKGLPKLEDAAHHLKQTLLEKWVFWFFSYLVVPLVQSNFYVTESEHGKQNIYYYRKSTWEKLKNRAIAHMSDQNFLELDAADVRSILGDRSFGFSKLRLRPKQNGVRMIANLKGSSRLPAQECASPVHPSGLQKSIELWSRSNKFKQFKPVNWLLRDMHAVLKGTQLKEPEKLGSSVFDYHDIYRKLCPFLISLKNRSNTMPDVFIVVADVSKAFDSIDQDKLLSVMKEVILKDEYLLKQCHHVICTRKSLLVREHLVLAENFLSNVSSISAGFTGAGSVLVDQGYSKYLKREELLFNLYEHVKCNVLQLDKKFYLQSIGISQGSILSPLLCSLYYGHLERNEIFPFLDKNSEAATQDLSSWNICKSTSAAGNSSEDKVISSPSYVLFRLIDDILFISTSRKQAASFFSMLRGGFREYNCYMNERKFCLNFDIGDMPRISSNKVYIGEDGISFVKWSGLLLNTSTLEIQADYTRYISSHLSSSLCVCLQDKPRHYLRVKLCRFMMPKCHPIFFDSNINSAPVVRLNIFQAFLLCAMKFHSYVSDMSYICKLNARTYLNIIKRSFRFMYGLIKRRMRLVSRRYNVPSVLHLEKEEVDWLGLNAYIQALKRKQSRHKDLLSLLKSKLSAHAIGNNVPPQLKYAVDSSHSSMFWKIKY